MRARLQENDILFMLNLLHREKELHDKKVKDMQDEIDLLETWIKKWRWRLINWSYHEFKPGLEFMKSRLVFLKSEQHFTKTLRYSHSLRYLTRRYESLLKGKIGRPLSVGCWGYSNLEEAVKETRP